MIEHSEKVDALTAALVAAISEMGPAVKNSLNPHFKKKYADLATLIEVSKEPLLANGLVLMQHPISEFIAGSDKAPPMVLAGCETMLVHTSGQWYKSSLLLPCEGLNAQKGGSAITYAKRYTMEGILMIPSVDDDGNAASEPAPAPVAFSSGKMLAEIDRINDVTSLTAFYKSMIEPAEMPESIKLSLVQACTRRKEEIEGAK